VLVAKFTSPEYVAVIVSAAAPGNVATHVAVVLLTAVLTGLDEHRFTGVVKLLFV
jgi:hypothetical protein